MTDDVSISVNGQIISGWTRIRITRGIERMPADFEIEMTEPYANNSVAVAPGSSCKVFIGKNIVLSGYVDVYEIRIEGNDHTVSISGRSMSEDLVDCSAEYPNAQIMSQSVLQIVQALATTPYGIKVSQNSFPDQTKNTIPQISLMYGETAVELIQRICRFAGLLFYDMPDGSILLTTASSQKAASGFQEGVNVQSATARFTMNRYSDYICVLQSIISTSDGQSLNSGQNNSMNQFFDSQDGSVPRNRKKFIVVESGDYENLGGVEYPVTHQRAIWENNRRYGKAFEARVVTDNWRDSAGNLWAPNTLADLNLPTLKIPKSTWLISEVTYSLDGSGGTTATLTLNPAQAFIPEPIVLIPNPIPEGLQNSTGAQIPTPAHITADQLVAPSVAQIAQDSTVIGATK